MNKDRMKFRAWHKKRKKYYEVQHLHLDSNEGVWATCKGYNCIEDKDVKIQIQPNDCIIEQGTGRNDKDKNLIFNGDKLLYVVEYDDYHTCRKEFILIVSWEEDRWLLRSECGNLEESIYNWNDSDFEIIGNIHD